MIKEDNNNSRILYIYICIINLKLNLKTCFDTVYSIDSKNQNWYIKV